MTTTVSNLQALREKVIKSANVAIYQAALEVVAEAKSLVNKGTYGQHSNPGNPPNFQTGDLYRSIQARGPNETGVPLRATVGSTEPQGKWMEFGVPIITAKRTRFLPVPINLAAQIMLRRVDGTSLRTQKLKLVKKEGKAFLMETSPTGKKIKKGGAVFVLKRSIRIAPRPWLLPALKLSRDAVSAKFAKVFTEQMEASK